MTEPRMCDLCHLSDMGGANVKAAVRGVEMWLHNGCSTLILGGKRNSEIKQRCEPENEVSE